MMQRILITPLVLASAVLVARAAEEETHPVPDLRKSRVEAPVKAALSVESPRAPGAVKPGDVKWHPSLAAAVETARNTGRPVLLFQLLGRLDEEFC